MFRQGVSSVMQCWYFGNYPGLMNKAAGMLAREDFEASTEKEFLERLAREEWGDNASGVAAAPAAEFQHIFSGKSRMLSRAFRTLTVHSGCAACFSHPRLLRFVSDPA